EISSAGRGEAFMHAAPAADWAATKAGNDAGDACARRPLKRKSSAKLAGKPVPGNTDGSGAVALQWAARHCRDGRNLLTTPASTPHHARPRTAACSGCRAQVAELVDALVSGTSG